MSTVLKCQSDLKHAYWGRLYLVPGCWLYTHSYEESSSTSSVRPAPPSDENITADIICQPYIYRDAYSTGLTQLSGLSLLANLPLTVALSDGNPSDAVVTNCNSEQMRLALIRRIRPQALNGNRGSTITTSTTNSRNSEITVEPPDQNDNDNVIIDTNEDDEDEEIAADLHSLPPDYSNATNNMSSIRIDNETDSINSNYEQPPPSYYECVKFGTNLEENGNLLATTSTTERDV